eukprot:g6029.t1
MIDRAREDPDAFGRLYRAHHAAIASMLYRRTGDAHAAEDLAAQTFINAWKGLDRYTHTGAPLRAWLMRIAINEARRWAKRQSRRREVESGATPSGAGAADLDEGGEVRAAIRGLSLDHQDVLTLVYFESLSVEQAALVLGVRPGTVKLPAWPDGSPPDTNPRVEAFLKEQAMSSSKTKTLKRSTIAIIAAGVLGGGSLAAAVTHRIMSHRATIITDDGTEYQVELLDTPEGAAGTWEMEDGTVYGINMIEEGGEQKSVTVDIDSPKGGTSTVILNDGELKPKVTVAPGQKAQIFVGESDGAPAGAFIDDDGNTFEVDQDAIDTWVQDEDADD